MHPEYAAPFDPILVLESERLFLQDLLKASDGIAGLKSAPAPYDRRPFPDGGKWRGNIPKALVRKGIIVPFNYREDRYASEHANRPTRNGSWLALWKLANREAAERRLADLNARSKRGGGEGLFDRLP